MDAGRAPLSLQGTEGLRAAVCSQALEIPEEIPSYKTWQRQWGPGSFVL